MAGGSADLAVAHDWLGVPMTLPDGMEARHLGDDVSDVLVNVDHPAAGATSLALQEFINDTWLYEPGSVAHDFLLHEFSRVDGAVRGHMIIEYATQIDMVGAGLGVALVPRMGRGSCRPPCGRWPCGLLQCAGSTGCGDDPRPAGPQSPPRWTNSQAPAAIRRRRQRPPR